MNSELQQGQERRSRTAVALLCVALTLLAVAPFYWMGQPPAGGSRSDFRMPVTHDMFEHWDQMRSFYQGLQAGEIYPRWEEDTNYGFGAPTTMFYPPGIYYLTSALYVVLRDWLRALFAAHLLILCASGAAIYWLARRSMSRAAAAFAMAAYILLPYHLADQYYREAIAELLGFVCMPLMLGFADELLSEATERASGQNDAPLAVSLSGPPLRRRKLARQALLACGFGAACGAFLWSHPPTAYQFSLALAVTLPVLALLRRNWRGLLWIGGGTALGLGFSAAYLLPAAVEAKFIGAELLAENWPYAESYLLQAGAKAQFPAFLALLNHCWWLGLLATAGVVAAFVTLAPKAPEAALPKASENANGSPSRLRSSVAAWAILSCFVSFMMLRQSDFIGRHIPKVEIGVFSWRMLAVSTLAVALLAGAAAQAALDARRAGARARFAAFAALVVAIFIGAGWISAFEVVAPANAFRAFQPPQAHLNYLIVPQTASCPDDLPRVDRVQAQGAGAAVSISDWKPQHRVIEVNAASADPVVVRTFNFPGWEASVDGQSVPLGTLASTGAIVVGVPQGAHTIALDFVDTPVRRLGAAVTVASALAMLALGAMSLFAWRMAKPKMPG